MRIKLWVTTGYVNSKVEEEFDIEMDEEDWENLSAQDRDNVVFEVLLGSGLIEWEYELLDK